MPSQLEPALSPGTGLVQPRPVTAELGEVAVRHGELPSRWQPFEQRHGSPAGLLGFRHPAGAPEDLGEPAQRIAFLSTVTDLAVPLQRVLSRLDRLEALIGEIALARPPLEQLGPFL
jgi:hypothetical protein